ncbi:type II secretion system F family protein [Methylocella silvestris]|uniref:Type II secretion system protein n=1 Tax=Methylocella silvestris TaxID=199596 RepID=A0A2J7TK55_METSI|nr:type II secretion system F family protein [Methylocella silvestris]PNG27148.1 type II secretion system protein [Methylocella silvestris]
MSDSLLWRLATVRDLMAPLGVIALVIGGAALIASSHRTRRDLVARRVDRLQPPISNASSDDEPEMHPAAARAPPLLALSLSPAERRQVVWLFSRLQTPAHQALLYFSVARLGIAASFGVLTLIFAGRVSILAGSLLTPLLAALAATAFGWILPAIFIAFGVRRRTKAVAAGLPDALELLVVCVEAGLSLEDALQRVAQELKNSQPALADELTLTWAEINILPSREQALANLADRVNVPTVKSVVSMISQSLRYGTPLAQSLRVGATEMRNDQMTLLEERANRLPALMTIPVMLFILPTLFLIVGGPAALRLIDMFRGGMSH